MGQAKQRGTKEERVAELNHYRSKLEELSQYGLSMELLNKKCQGDVKLVEYYINQIKIIQKNYPNKLVSVYLQNGRMKVGVMNADYRPKTSLEKDFQDNLVKIKAPKNLNYNILFNDVDKQTFDSIYPYEFNEFEKSFDLITGQSISYFEQLILDNFPNSFFSKDEIDYYLKVLVFASNHPFLSDKRYCFFIARTTKVL